MRMKTWGIAGAMVLLAGAFWLLAAGAAPAQTEVVLEPTVDIWIRQSKPDTAYPNDWVSVWGSEGGKVNTSRVGLLEFDVSGITQPIQSAKLQLYAIDNGHNLTKFEQETYLVSPPGIGETITWNSYYSGYTEEKLDSFGYYSFEANSAVAQYYDSQTASAADLAKFEARRTTNGKLTFALKAGTWTETVERTLGRREWADRESYFHPSDTLPRPAKLVINGGQTVLTVSDDTWIHERDPDIDRADDWVSVWSHESNGALLQRWGLLQFDLSAVSEPITSAVLQMFAIDTAVAGSANAEPFEQEAYLVNVDSLAGQTWNTYQAGGYTEQALDSLGHYWFEANTTNDQYFDSDAASTLDAAALEALRVTAAKATFLLKAVPITVTQEILHTGEREWGDKEALGQPPKLVLTFGASVHAGDANSDGKVDDLDASILAANWQRTGGATWAQADFNNDGNVNDLDASILAANWQYGVGATVPEPATSALLLSALATAAALGARRRAS